MEKLENILIGFSASENADQTKSKVEELACDTTDVSVYNRESAHLNFLTEGSKPSLTEEWVRFFQRNIGGGPSEFLRDVEQMGADEILVVVSTQDLEKSELERLKKDFASIGFAKAKHFGSFGVEHFSTEPGHRKEGPEVEQ